ncbi:hypothetical protein H0H87_004670, partial [Tephrocybe sp. NHM501043]
MLSNDNEDLIDYEDELEIVSNRSSSPSVTNGAAASGAGEGKVHSTGFRFVIFLSSFPTFLLTFTIREFFLNPELLKMLSNDNEDLIDYEDELEI